MQKINKSIAVTKTYPFKTKISLISCKKRIDEINSCKSPKVKDEKYYSWILLEESLKDFFDIDASTLEFDKDKFGKWSTKDFYFSISHSGNLVSVAISNKKIGIDVQEIKDVDIKRMILNENDDKTEDSVSLLSKKEAIFKAYGNNNFIPLGINSNDKNLKSYKIEADSKQYYLNVISEEEVSIILDRNVMKVSL